MCGHGGLELLLKEYRDLIKGFLAVTMSATSTNAKPER
jgi:hypothetical protein